MTTVASTAVVHASIRMLVCFPRSTPLEQEVAGCAQLTEALHTDLGLGAVHLVPARVWWEESFAAAGQLFHALDVLAAGADVGIAVGAIGELHIDMASRDLIAADGRLPVPVAIAFHVENPRQRHG